MQKKQRRRFLGNIYTRTAKEDGTVIDKQELRFEAKHLKAYLKGHKNFIFGRYNDGSPKIHEVKQQYYYE